MIYFIYFVLFIFTTEIVFQLRQIDKANPEKKPTSFTSIFSNIIFFILILINIHLWGNVVGIILSILGFIGFISVTVGWLTMVPSTFCDLFLRTIEQINHGTTIMRRSLPVLAGVNLLFCIYLYINVQCELLLWQYKVHTSLIVITIIILIIGFFLRIISNNFLFKLIEYRHAMHIKIKQYEKDCKDATNSHEKYNSRQSSLFNVELEDLEDIKTNRKDETDIPFIDIVDHNND